MFLGVSKTCTLNLLGGDAIPTFYKILTNICPSLLRLFLPSHRFLSEFVAELLSFTGFRCTKRHFVDVTVVTLLPYVLTFHGAEEDVYEV